MYKVLWLLLAFTAQHAFAEQKPYDPFALKAALVEMTVERLQLMKDIAAHKWETDAPIFVPSRELQVLKLIGLQAERYGMSPDHIQQVWRVQFEMSKGIQEFWHAHWRSVGYTPWGKPSLTALRQRINGIDTQLLNDLYTVLPILHKEKAQGRQFNLAAITVFPIDPRYVATLSEALSGVQWQPYGKIQAVMPRIRKSNLLRVGTTADYPPFSYIDSDGEHAGIDIALAKMLARSLTVDLMIVPTTWPTLMQDLENQYFDVAMSGITVTDSRRENALFSDSYHSGGKSAIGRCEDVDRYRKVSNINRPSVRVIVNPGGTNQRFVDEKIKRANVRVYDDNVTIFQEILSGKADVMFTDQIEIDLQTKIHAGKLCPLLKKLVTRHNKAYMTPLRSVLPRELNILLERLRVSARLDTIISTEIDKAINR